MRAQLALTLFVLSLLGAAFGVGYIVKRESFFPTQLIETAINQIKSLEQAIIPGHLYPAVYEQSGTKIHSREAMGDGLTLITTYWKDADWRNEIRLLDADGAVIHRWPVRIGEYFNEINFDYVHGAHLFDNGDVLFNVEYAGLVRLDACGDVVWTSDHAAHHAVHPAGDGTFWVPVVDSIATKQAAKEAPGLGKGARIDKILQYTASGEVKRTINLLDVLYSEEVLPYMLKNPAPQGFGTHLNDVETLPEDIAKDFSLFDQGDIMLSFRNKSLIVVLDRDDLSVTWTYSGDLIYQHDPDFLPGGWIGIYNNNASPLTHRGNAIGGSEIVAVQPHTGNTRNIFPKDDTRRFYSKTGGKWQKLPNGNVLTIEPRAGRVFEATAEGEVVWEWINHRYGDSWLAGPNRVPEVLQATRYPITPSDVAAWPCGSATAREPAAES